MITIRKREERGHFDHGWLDTYHTFSFADYYDPYHMGYRDLRVINEDFVAPGRGFGMHPHRDMEIITYVLEGSLAHHDSMGTGSVITPGEVQRMSAGTGVRHSEVNASKSERVHLLQIWILPDAEGIAPSYEQKTFPASERDGRLRIVASPDAREGSLRIHQNVSLYAALLNGGEPLTHTFAAGRHGWLQVAAGEVQLNGETLRAGDGAAIDDEGSISIVGTGEVLLFDLN